MTVNLYSVLSEAEKKFWSFSSSEFLAKSSALIDSTLSSINFYEDGDIDRHYECKVVLHDGKRSTLEKLLILSWYVPKNLGWYLRMAIHDRIQNNIDLVDLEFPLKSESCFKVWISERVSHRGTNWFFGNYLNKKEWEQFLKSLNTYFSVKRYRNHKCYNDTTPEKRVIGVGYKDKGTLPKDARGGNKNFMLTSVQNELEENRDICETTKYLIEGFLM